MPKTIFPAVVELSELNGKNGFKINGEAEGDRNGFSVSNAGDLNNDGIGDLIVGSFFATPSGRNIAGVSYVIFGHNSTWITPMELSTLNGANGLKINGEAIGDYSGCSVSTAGDINGDGIDDIVIGAQYTDPNGKENAGSSYVIFGHADDWTTPLELSTLNGINGFKINGEVAGDQSGYPVNRAGDINGDGIDDIIIGAHYVDPGARDYAGSSYVVFGHGGHWLTPLELSTLNGTNGIKINGEMTDDYSSYSVSTAGDINGDGVDDIIIGAWGADPGAKEYAGSSYVVFGHGGAWLTPLELLTLNGTNGFKVNGEITWDFSGWSVSHVGDINGDGIDDFIIGARSANDAGSSYVVFGHTDDWTTPLELSTINGINGFRIDGEATNDNSGHFVSGAGDINGDGIDDFIISANQANPSGKENAGSSYVIFGHTGDWATPLELSTLNGVNGFKMNGEVAGDLSGAIVSNAGDVNGDGINDIIIGAYGADPNGKDSAGASYVIFGDISTAEMTANQLTIHEGEIKSITLSDLNAIDNSHHEIHFAISALEYGYFENINDIGNATTRFSKQDIENNVIRFVHDGDEFPPTYNITICTEAFARSQPFSADITFIHINDVPKLNVTATALNYVENDPATALDADLVIIDPDNAELINATIAMTHNFHAGQDILEFSDQNNISGYYDNTTGILTLTGSSSLENYQTALRNVTYYNPSDDITTDIRTISFMVNDGVDKSNPITRNINVISENDLPILINNQLTITEGDAVVLTSNELSATDLDDEDAHLVFTVNNVQRGQFKSKYNSEEITTFTQRNISAGDISFLHDGSNDAPSYAVRVSDGQVTNIGGYQSAYLNFTAINDMPVLIYNELMINQGQKKVLTTSDLSATDEETANADLIFTMSNLQHGYFEDIQTTTEMTTFAQSKIVNSDIRFVHDGSAHAPSYAVSVNDGLLSTSPASAVISFFRDAPTTTDSSNINNSIVGGVVSGVIGVFFFAFKLYVSRKAAKSFEKITESYQTSSMKEQAAFQTNVIRPIAKAIFDRIKVTGFLGYTDDSCMKAYLDAVIKIIVELIQQGIDVNFSQMTPVGQSLVISEIVKQTRNILIPKQDCCSCGHFMNFFSKFCVAEITPEKLEENACKIALSVRASLQANKLDSFLSRQSVVSAQTNGAQVDINRVQETSIEMDDLGRKTETLVDIEDQDLTGVTNVSDKLHDEVRFNIPGVSFP